MEAIGRIAVERTRQLTDSAAPREIQHEWWEALGRDKRIHPSLYRKVAFIWSTYGAENPKTRMELCKLKADMIEKRLKGKFDVGPWAYLKGGLTRICRQFGVDYP